MSNKTGYKKGWYKEWFGEDYLTVYQHRDNNDAIRLIDLILKHIKIHPDTRLLDLACGNGRHSYLISKYTSKVLGLDLSASLLKVAQKRKVTGQFPAFVRADMRYFPFKISFDVIFSLFTSFGYFDDDSMHLQVAKEIADCLVTKGDFVIDYFNADYVKKNLIPQGTRNIGRTEVVEERWISSGRVHKKITLYKRNSEKHFYESVRMFELDEMTALLGRAGIKTGQVYGNYDGSDYNPDSKRMIIFSKKIL
jgi:SAM-dependent methyltransferase